MMIDILYNVVYWPVSWHVYLALGCVLAVSLCRLPSSVITVLVGAGMWIYSVDVAIMSVVLAILILGTVPVLRQYVLSTPIMLLAIKFRIFPKVSDTEKAALEAGTVWMDKELFSGSPNIKRLMTQQINH